MIKRLLYIQLIIIVFSCAVQGPNLGGPQDVTPPSVLSTFPFSESVNLNRTQEIIIFFDEMINPASVYSGIEVSANFENYKVRVKGNHKGGKIILTPDNEWLGSEFLSINLNRYIADYRGNKLNKPIRLIYSFSDNIPPKGSISGKLSNINNDTIYEIILFDVKDEMLPVTKVQSNIDNEYIFEFIPPGRYVVGALESFFDDNYGDKIRRYRYALGCSDFIDISENTEIFEYNLKISDPITKVGVESTNFINSNFGYMTFSDGSVNPLFIDELKNKSINLDTLIYETTIKNNIEEYLVGPLKLIIPSIEDTIKPVISSYVDIGDSIEIMLSEPINILADSNVFFDASDSTMKSFLDFSYDNRLRLTINSQDSLIGIINNLIYDYSNNILKDTLLTVDLTKEENESYNSTYISGNVEFFGDYMSMIRAVNINSGKKYFTKSDTDNKFIFNNVEPGMYYIDAYEILNEIDEEKYFSGTWNPYSRAARFSEVLGPIELRPGWDVEDINIIIK